MRLDGPELLIGRAIGVDLHIDAPDVSRTHAKIFRYGFDFAVRDLGSRNGILLNGMRVSSAVLRDGDLIRVGPAIFMYIEGG
jgi:pSer/pThr/pTyr-binding forkhead associated (FHA) protein